MYFPRFSLISSVYQNNTKFNLDKETKLLFNRWVEHQLPSQFMVLPSFNCCKIGVCCFVFTTRDKSLVASIISCDLDAKFHPYHANVG